MGTYSGAWVSRYIQQSYIRIDPLILGCFQRFHPVDWKDLDWSQRKPDKPVKFRASIIKTCEGAWDWNDSRPCDKLLLAQVRRAKQQEEESQAIQLQGLTKLSSFKRIVDWSRLNTGEWEKMLGQPEEWMSEDQRREGWYEYYDDNTGLPLENKRYYWLQMSN